MNSISIQINHLFYFYDYYLSQPFLLTVAVCNNVLECKFENFESKYAYTERHLIETGKITNINLNCQKKRRKFITIKAYDCLVTFKSVCVFIVYYQHVVVVCANRKICLVL